MKKKINIELIDEVIEEELLGKDGLARDWCEDCIYRFEAGVFCVDCPYENDNE